VVVDGHGEDLLRLVLADDVLIEDAADLRSQMNTEGPAMSFFTSCWLLPQKEQ
jgi:hypothetical protein